MLTDKPRCRAIHSVPSSQRASSVVCCRCWFVLVCVCVCAVKYNSNSGFVMVNDILRYTPQVRHMCTHTRPRFGTGHAHTQGAGLWLLRNSAFIISPGRSVRLSTVVSSSPGSYDSSVHANAYVCQVYVCVCVAPHVSQAFSHFTWSHSKGQRICVDIQGVGDLYTDPQIHTLDGEMYGVSRVLVYGCTTH